MDTGGQNAVALADDSEIGEAEAFAGDGFAEAEIDGFGEETN